MQEIRSSNPPVVNGICGSNKSRARHHRSANQYNNRSFLVAYITSIKVARVVKLKSPFMEWFFYNLVMLIKLYKI